MPLINRLGQEEALATRYDCPSLWEGTFLAATLALLRDEEHVYPFEGEVNLVLRESVQRCHSPMSADGPC